MREKTGWNGDTCPATPLVTLKSKTRADREVFAVTLFIEVEANPPPNRRRSCGIGLWVPGWMMLHASSALSRLGAYLRLLLCSPLVAQLLGAGSTEWTHLRGPVHEGRFEELDAAPIPGVAEPRILWEREVGQGFSGMVAAGDRIYTQAQSSQGQHLICLSITTGHILWRRRYAFPWELNSHYPGPFGTPSVDGERVYFTDCFGVIGCADVRDGSIGWQFDAVKRLGLEGTDFGYAPSPLVVEGRLYMPAPAGRTAPTALALDGATGQLLWTAGSARPSYSSCLRIQVRGQQQIVVLHRNGIVGLDPKTGAELWTDVWSTGYNEHSSWPLYAEPYLFCASPFRRGSRVYRLLRELSRGETVAELVWQDKALSNDILSSALHEGYVYVFDVLSQQAQPFGKTRGLFVCLELSTGKTMWTQDGVGYCSVSSVGIGLTWLCGRMIFCVPLTLFASFIALLLLHGSNGSARRAGRAEVPRVISRLALLAFSAGCLLYYVLCASTTLAAGWGFLTGLPIALPFGLRWVRMVFEGSRAPALLAFGILTFSSFYWSAAGITYWSTR